MKTEDESGTIFDVRELTVHDGPGVRTTIFFKGCPLRCLWCHNPEGLLAAPELMADAVRCTGCGSCRVPCSHAACVPFERCARRCPEGLLRIVGETWTSSALATRMHRLAPLLHGGGITLSGGEPLKQPAFLLALLERLAPLHVIVETSGHAPLDVFKAVADACSVMYLDLKHADSARHRSLTGVGNGRILGNLDWIKRDGRPFLVRIPLIPGCNDDADNLRATAELLAGASGLQRVELLPLNPFSAAKYGMLGKTFPLEAASLPFSVLSAQDPASFFTVRGIACAVL